MNYCFSVIHLSEWSGNSELFNSWFSYAICESIGSTSPPKSTTVTTKRPKVKTTSKNLINNKNKLYEFRISYCSRTI